MKSPCRVQSITADTRGMTREQVRIAMDYMGKQNALALATAHRDALRALLESMETEWRRISREEAEARHRLETTVLGRPITRDELDGRTPVRSLQSSR